MVVRNWCSNGKGPYVRESSGSSRETKGGSGGGRLLGIKVRGEEGRNHEDWGRPTFRRRYCTCVLVETPSQVVQALPVSPSFLYTRTSP